MRRRCLRAVAMAITTVMALLPISAPAAQADSWPDAYTQIVNRQIALPIQPDGEPTYMSNGWGRYYSGPNGLEIRLNKKGTLGVVKFVLTTGSLAIGTAITGEVTPAADAILAAISSQGIRTMLVAANAYFGDSISQTLQELALQNKCIGITVPPQTMDSWMNRFEWLLSASVVNAFIGPAPSQVQTWLEPCTSPAQASITVPVSLPGVENVLAAQPIVVPPSGNPTGYLDESGMAGFDKVFVRGWVIDPDTTGSVTVHTYVDGTYVGATTANTSRPDVGATYPDYGNNHGYYAEYSVGVGVHQVCTYALNVGSGNANPQLPYCKTVQRSLLDTHPAAVKSSSDIGQIFYRGANNDLETWWQTAPGSNWTGPLSLGNCVTDSPAAVTAPNGVIAAFARGCSGDLKTTWQTAPGSGTWNWASLGGNFTGSPAVVQTGSGVGQVFVRGTGGDLQTYWQSAPGSGWNGPLSLGGCITDSPSAIIAPSGVIAAFVRGCGGDLQTWWQTAPGSGTWNHVSIGGNFVGSPTVLQFPGGLGQVFVRGPNNDLQTFWQQTLGGTWQGPLSLGGQISGSIAALVTPDGKGAVFVGGTGGDLQTFWQPSVGSNWTGALSMGGVLG